MARSCSRAAAWPSSKATSSSATTTSAPLLERTQPSDRALRRRDGAGGAGLERARDRHGAPGAAARTGVFHRVVDCTRHSAFPGHYPALHPEAAAVPRSGEVGILEPGDARLLR